MPRMSCFRWVGLFFCSVLPPWVCWQFLREQEATRKLPTPNNAISASARIASRSVQRHLRDNVTKSSVTSNNSGPQWVNADGGGDLGGNSKTSPGFSSTQCRHMHYVGETCVLTKEYQRRIMSNVDMDPEVCDSRARKKEKKAVECDDRSPLVFMQKQGGCPAWATGRYECNEQPVPVRSMGPFLENTTIFRKALLGKRILLIGDSMMRQFFSTLMWALRGFRVGLDMHSNHGMFFMTYSSDHFLPMVEEHELSKPFSTNEAYFTAAFAFKVTWDTQKPTLLRIVTATRSAIDFLIITFACFWNFSDEYRFLMREVGAVLEKLLCEGTKRKACIKKIIILTCPTARLDSRKSKVVTRRNQNIKTWSQEFAAAHPGVSMFVDFDRDGMTNIATPGGSGNWHYQCSIEPTYVWWRKVAAQNMNIRIATRGDGGCSLMSKNPNRRLLQYILSSFIVP